MSGCKMLAFSVTGFEQICARWRAVVVTYNKSTDCANMTEAVRLKCSTGVGYGYTPPQDKKLHFLSNVCYNISVPIRGK